MGRSFRGKPEELEALEELPLYALGRSQRCARRATMIQTIQSGLAPFRGRREAARYCLTRKRGSGDEGVRSGELRPDDSVPPQRHWLQAYVSERPHGGMWSASAVRER